MLKVEKEFEQIKPKAKTLRSEFQKKRLLNEKMSNQQRHHIKRVLNKEKTKRDWKEIRNIYGKTKMGSVMEVEIKVEDGFEKVTTKKEVEEGIMRESEARFRLTEGTPFNNDLAKQVFGSLCEKEGTQQALQGHLKTSDKEKFTETTKMFLDLLKHNSSTKLKTTISTSDYIKAWKKKKEETY